jgi:hypothetical protein
MKSRCLLAFLIAVLFLSFGGVRVYAASVEAVHGSTPTIDGVIAGGEWIDASTVTSYLSYPIHQGDLIIAGNDVYTLEGRFDINGSIAIEDNATLVLRNALLNFVQTTNNQFNLTLRNPVAGNPRLAAYNSTIDSNANLHFDLKGNSTADLNRVTIPSGMVECYPGDLSRLSISNSSYVRTIFAESSSSSVIKVVNSTIHEWHNYGHNTAPEAQVYDSTIDSLLIGSSPVNCTISGLHPGLATHWNFIENCSVVSSGELGGAVPNITLTNTHVGLWRFGFYQSSTVTIIDSVVQASAFSQARIRIFWYVDVHVVDAITQDVPAATVTATYPNATLAESKMTGEEGWARLLLMEKTKNATGEYSVGTYTIEAAYETHSNTTSVEMTDSTQITLALEGLVIPEFLLVLILPIFMAATLLAVMISRRQRRPNLARA